ncbi:MAG: PKD domain-containing protein, partial [Nocardioides sp.]
MAVAAVVALVATLLALVGVTLAPASAVDTIAFRAGDQAAYNQATARATIPATVRAGDALLLFVTSNKALASVTTDPAGWTRLGTRLASTDTETILYSRVATATDAGKNAAVAFSATTKSTITLLAYSGTAADPVASFASAPETVSRATHTTPGASVADAGSVVVSYWADKSASLTTGWTAPAGQVQRSIALGTGAGRITSLASDSGSASPVGPAAGLSATAAVATAKATMWSVVLRPDPTTDPNVAPVARFTTSCPQSTCTVDASTSTDTAPGSVASYAWDFGDGTTGSGVSATHTYTSSGSKTITLVVTDDKGLASAPVTHTVSVTAAPSDTRPHHTRLVPDKPRTNMPVISNGEIFDIEVVPSINRVFIAGSFTSLANSVAPTTTINQAGLASYNYQTGL